MLEKGPPPPQPAAEGSMLKFVVKKATTERFEVGEALNEEEDDENQLFRFESQSLIGTRRSHRVSGLPKRRFFQGSKPSD